MGIPVVSVVMSVYNDAKYLVYSIESILPQESVDFDVAIWGHQEKLK